MAHIDYNDDRVIDVLHAMKTLITTEVDIDKSLVEELFNKLMAQYNLNEITHLRVVRR